MTQGRSVGLIVNPIAGIGGTVALKGSDGVETVKRALELGAVPVAPGRAVEMLRILRSLKPDVELITYPAEMGEEEAISAGFEPVVIGTITSGSTTAADTVGAARSMHAACVTLLLFVGGDGTARDIFKAVDGELPALGTPAGVKLHSSVFAVNPRRAAELAAAYLDRSSTTRDLEVMDVDEDLARQGRLSARLFGYLTVPYQARLLQGAKAGSRSGTGDAAAIAARIVEDMDDKEHYILGPGTTVRAIARRLGTDKTLLGVDVVREGRLVAMDATESELFEIASRHPSKIVVAVVGGQGYVLGRGNQQISPRVIRAVGSENLMIVATKDKLLALNGPLRVDTGEPECDLDLSGYRRVITGRHEESIWMVEA